MDDFSIKGRVRLWLQSERAMGMHWLPAQVPQRVIVDAPPVQAARRPAPPPSAPPAPRPQRAPAPAPPADVALPVVDMFSSPDAAPFEGPPLPREEKFRLLAELDAAQVKGCTKCRLSEARTHTVFGEGDPDAAIFFIGEGPGETEDQTGRPFVGRAGHKLDEMIGAMGLSRQQVFIGNIVKCRPPGNRAPVPDEVQACTPYLVRQLEIVRPRAIVTLGLPAAQYMLHSKESMGRLRGGWKQWRGIPLMPTYHPAYVLRNYTMDVRRAVWSDLQKVMERLGLKKG